MQGGQFSEAVPDAAAGLHSHGREDPQPRDRSGDDARLGVLGGNTGPYGTHLAVELLDHGEAPGCCSAVAAAGSSLAREHQTDAWRVIAVPEEPSGGGVDEVDGAVLHPVGKEAQACRRGGGVAGDHGSAHQVVLVGPGELPSEVPELGVRQLGHEVGDLTQAPGQSGVVFS